MGVIMGVDVAVGVLVGVGVPVAIGVFVGVLVAVELGVGVSRGSDVSKPGGKGVETVTLAAGVAVICARPDERN